MMDLTSLHSKLVAEVGELLFYLKGQGCDLCLVGGVTRDFFLTGDLVKDIDIEVRSTKTVEELLAQYPDKLNYEKLSYDIIKVYWNEHIVEFSPPRKETFIEGDFSHKNFTATIDQSLTYEQSFARRDFTINAIGLEFHKDKLVLQDPYQGLNDIRDEQLRPVSSDFIKDPVRFLRLLRFSLRLNFAIGDDAMATMPQFNLQNLSTYYFKTEWHKAKNANKFLELFYRYTKEFTLIVPDWTLKFMPITCERTLENPEDYLVQCFYQGRDLDLENPHDFFSLNKSEVKALKEFVETLKTVNWQQLIGLKSSSFEQVKNQAEFLKLHNLSLLDRQDRFATMLSSLDSMVSSNYLKFARTHSVSPLPSQLPDREKASYKSYLKFIKAFNG